jgi:hypothetical protein
MKRGRVPWCALEVELLPAAYSLPAADAVERDNSLPWPIEVKVMVANVG